MFSFNFSTYPAFPLFLRGILPYAHVFAACKMFLHPVLYFYYHLPRCGEYSVHVLPDSYFLFFPRFLCMNIPGLYICFHKIRKNNRNGIRPARRCLSSRWGISSRRMRSTRRKRHVSSVSVGESNWKETGIAKLRLPSAGLNGSDVPSSFIFSQTLFNSYIHFLNIY